jgi:trimethylamine--corrinoid protein Co-methyltransferase
MFIVADLGMPQIPGPAVQPGATGPVTLAGALAQLVAEGLMALTLIQLRRPGAPCFLGGNLPVFDMRTATMSIGAPEMSLGMAAQAEVAQSFGLPSWGLAGSTDAKTLDAQAGIESAFSILAQGLAGLNLIHDVGYMDMAMVCSVEMLVLGDEVIGMAKRFIRGIEVNAETLAREVVEQVGPGGHFLQEDHTYRHFRQELWRPSLLARQEYSLGQADGAKEIGQRIREKLEEIDGAHQAPPLPQNVLAALDRLKRKAEENM